MLTIVSACHNVSYWSDVFQNISILQLLAKSVFLLLYFQLSWFHTSNLGMSKEYTCSCSILNIMNTPSLSLHKSGIHCDLKSKQNVNYLSICKEWFITINYDIIQSKVLKLLQYKLLLIRSWQH